jgi:hypothetical protein
VVGDSYDIPVEFSPAELSNNAVYWRSMDDAIATFHNGTLVGMAEGMTRAYAFSTIDRLRDTCVVCVLPDFYVAPGNYPYDMVVYASVNLHGTMLTTDNANSVVIGAYVGDQLRGVGKMQRHHDTDYLLLRIWSPYSYGEELSLRCYYRGQARAEVFPDVIVFDGEHLGTLSNLYPLVLDENAQEYLPDADFGEDNPYIIGTDTTHVVIYD